MIEGRDVSSHQGNYELESGLDFIFIKATEDRNYANPWMATVSTRAWLAGLVVGYYHFLHPGNPLEQAAHFVKIASPRPGELLVCDWEKTVAGQATVAEVAEFMREVKRLAPGHRVGLYCNTSDWKNTPVKAGDFLWIADPSSPRGNPQTTSPWVIHQYSWTPLDKNAAVFESRREMADWAEGRPLSPFRVSGRSAYGEFGLWQGQRVNRRTYEAVTKAAELANWGPVRLSQGGLSGSVTASAKTHLGLDCGDIMVSGHTKAEVWAFCLALMECGAFPFPRGYVDDSFQNMKHIHFGMVAAEGCHPQMKAQYASYKRGRDGLAGNRAYTGPTRLPLTTWARSKHNPANGPQSFVVDPAKVTDKLWGIRKKGDVLEPLTPGTRIDAERIVWKAISRDGNTYRYALTPEGIHYNTDYLKEIRS